MVGGDIEGVLPTIHHAYAHMCVHVERREGLVVMTNFIVASQAKVDDVTQRLSETVFGSPEGFILAYNQHLLNAKNATVAAFAHDITAAYKNVESANRRITIIPDDEVYFNEIISRATLWKDFVTVRRMVAGVAKKVIQRGGLTPTICMWRLSTASFMSRAPPTLTWMFALWARFQHRLFADFSSIFRP